MPELDLTTLGNGALLWRDDELERRQVRLPDGSPAMLVRPLQPGGRAAMRLAYEWSLRARLDARWAARPKALLPDEAGLILEAPLDARPLETQAPGTGAWLDAAIALSEALAGLHDAGLVHEDLRPGHVLLRGDRAWLTGFGHAGPPGRRAGEGELVSHFAYMAPEQTGRLDHAVDERADLYAAGVMLALWLTGKLPFNATDALDWLHAHLARPPLDPEALGAPAMPAAIVRKLLAKSPDERYQSAAGLLADLKRCRESWDRDVEIAPFPLAERDVIRGVRFSDRLYGREREQAALAASFQRVAATGRPEWVLITGYSGSGKSALVEALARTTTGRSRFVAGKFEQFKADVPFFGLSRAFAGPIRELLAGDEAALSAWRERVEAAVGRNGRVLTAAIPELEWVLGPQPEVVELGPTEARNRFEAVFRQFIGVWAAPDQPLVLFLDDLQWIDPASLDLLTYLAAQHEVRHLLVVGAYRDNEVDATHRLSLALERMRRGGTAVLDVELGPLDEADLAALLSDALRLEPARVAPLTALVHQKTGGNPFFTIQLLASLADERLLLFHADLKTWTWDEERISRLADSDNVVDLMVAKLRRLPDATRDVLTSFACLGRPAAAADVARASGISVDAAAEALQDAEQAGFLARGAEGYRFKHDRIQEAAYSLIPEAERPGRHLAIGRMLAAELTDEDAPFEAADHLNQGAGLLTDAAERRRVCELDFRAGRQAKGAIAYAAALGYFGHARALLAVDAWVTHGDQTLALHLELAECEYLAGDPAMADVLFDEAYAHASDVPARVETLWRRMRTYMGGRPKDALAVGLEALSLLGVTFPAEDAAIGPAHLDAQARFEAARGGRAIAELADLPVATDPTARTIMGLMTLVGVAAYNARPMLAPLVYCTALEMALKWGNTAASCMTYISYGSYCVALGRVEDAFAFAALGLALNERFGDVKLRGTLLYVQGAHVNFWKRPFRTSVPILEGSFRACQEVGDLAFAANAAALLLTILVEAGERPSEVASASRRYAAYARSCHNEVIHAWSRLCEHLTSRLAGERMPEPFDDAACLATFQARKHLSGIAKVYVVRQMLAVWEGRDEEALAAGLDGAEAVHAVRSTPVEAMHHFYHALALAKAGYREALEPKLALLRRWASQCPENYTAHEAIITAEAARLDGRDFEAMRGYERAVEAARANGLVQLQGLAHELAARFYGGLGLASNALGQAKEACACYRRWGAGAVAARLEREYPEVVPEAGPTDARATRLEHLDLLAVLQASQAVSSDIVLERLGERLIAIALQHAGADRGLLVLGDQVVASASAGADGLQVDLARRPASDAELPASVLKVVAKTREPVVIPDLRAAHPFASDAYWEAHQPRAALGLPLLKQGALVGVLYLENHLAPGTFGEDRTAVLELLASQAAISLENAALYEEMSQLNASLEERVQARTGDLDLALREQAAILDNALTGIAFIRDRVVVRCNEAFEKLFGYGPGELAGRSTRLLYGSDEEYAAIEADVYPVLREGGDIFRDSLRRRRDGSSFWCTSNVKSINPAAPDQGLVWVIQDITARREAEQAQAQARERADRANASKTDFLAHMSHEIRTPLTAMLASADLLMAGDQQQDYAAMIRRNGDHLLALIDDILDMSKIEAGQLTVEHLPCPLEPLMQDMESLMRPRAMLKDVTLAVTVAPSVPAVVLLDPTRLRQIVLNLVGNAIKFTSHGQVTVALGYLGGQLTLEVSDTGIGIAPEHLGSLFQPFQQADATVTRRFGGTGLGLAISRQLAEALGGRLDVRSTPGVGSTFTLTLSPAVAPGTRSVSMIQAPRQPRTPSGLSTFEGRVLLAEDGPDNQVLLRVLISRFGPRVAIASDGQEALAMALDAQAAGQPFELVLMDMQMPVMDGFEATRELRARGYALPIVALTANAMAGERERCLAAGCDDYMVKPIDRQTLGQTLERFMALSRNS